MPNQTVVDVRPQYTAIVNRKRDGKFLLYRDKEGRTVFLTVKGGKPAGIEAFDKGGIALPAATRGIGAHKEYGGPGICKYCFWAGGTIYWPTYHEYVCVIIPCSEPTGKITALHFPWVVITIYSTEQSKEYQVTAETQITVNGQRGAFSNLATGMDAAVFTKADPTANPTVAVTIDAKSP